MPHRFPSPAIFLLFGVLVGFLWDVEARTNSNSEYFARSWLADEGLPTSAANDVVQDGEGFLWVATPEGVVRFDGYQFKPITSPLIAKVSAKNIRALAINADGSVLMLPAVGGLVVFKNQQFRAHPAAAGLEGRELRDIFVERDGPIWLEMEGGRVRRWSPNYVLDFGPEEGLNERVKASFAQSNNGEVWMASGGFVARYEDGKLHPIEGDPRYAAVLTSSSSGGVWVCKGTALRKLDGHNIHEISTNLPWVPMGGLVRVMHEDRSGALWIGTAAHGLYLWKDGQFEHVGIIRSEVKAIKEDGEGSVWVASEGSGLTRLRPKLFELFNSASGLAVDVTDSVSADRRGNVWVANRGGGVGQIVGEQAGVVQFPTGSHRLRAYSICADDRRGVWVMMDVGLYRFESDAPLGLALVNNAILDAHVFYCSSKGDMWVGGENGFLGRYVESQPNAFALVPDFPGNRIRCMTEDATGRLWIGTEEGQLFRRENGKFVRFDHADGLPEVPIRAMYADSSGNVWLGTVGGGLVLVRGDNFIQISSKNGLPDNYVAAILEDDQGRLWLGTRAGIFHVAKADLERIGTGALARVEATTFGRSEGLFGVSCAGSVQPMACKTPDGRLWFATRTGVVAIDVARIKVIRQPPPVFIDEVVVDDSPLVAAEDLQVPPLSKRMEFHFAVLSFAAPEKVRIRYFLEGFDLGWTEMSRRDVIYPRLSPGRYQMHVKACNSDGVWNETGATLAFTVLPAWWQKWWVRGLAAALAVYALAIGVRHWSNRQLRQRLAQHRQKRAIERERERIARDIHDDMGAGLTQILLQSALARRNPGDSAHLEQISSTAHELVGAMDEIVWAINPENDSLDELVTYIGKLVQDYTGQAGLRCRLELPAQLPDLHLLAEARHNLFLAVKETLNNIVKHAQATEVGFSMSLTSAGFSFVIKDNGRGFVPGSVKPAAADDGRLASGNGLRNLARRLQSIGGRCEISSEPGRGTTVELTVPFPNAKRPLSTPVGKH